MDGDDWLLEAVGCSEPAIEETAAEVDCFAVPVGGEIDLEADGIGGGRYGGDDAEDFAEVAVGVVDKFCGGDLCSAGGEGDGGSGNFEGAEGRAGLTGGRRCWLGERGKGKKEEEREQARAGH